MLFFIIYKTLTPYSTLTQFARYFSRRRLYILRLDINTFQNGHVFQGLTGVNGGHKCINCDISLLIADRFNSFHLSRGFHGMDTRTKRCRHRHNILTNLKWIKFVFIYIYIRMNMSMAGWDVYFNDTCHQGFLKIRRQIFWDENMRRVAYEYMTALFII